MKNYSISQIFTTYLFALTVFATLACTGQYVPQSPIVPPLAIDSTKSCGCGPSAAIQDPAKPETPKPEPQMQTVASLPIPSFSIDGGRLPYGTSVLLRSDSLPTQTIYEYSWNDGKNWIVGDSIFLCKSGELIARTRQLDKVSKAIRKSFLLYYNRVLIVGNSITGHGPAPEIGWTGDWGMAASRADSDYVHLLTKDLKIRNPATELKVMYGVPFEQTFPTYDFNQANESADFKPDLIIMRIGENANVASEMIFKEKYDKLIKKLLSKTATAKVICTTSFWPDKYEAINVIKTVAKTNDYVLVDIGGFFQDKSYTAQGLFKDPGVAKHPSDKGMRAIYNAIAEKL